MVGSKYVSEDNPLPVYIVNGGGGGSDGDMKKEVYDPNDNGFVDRAGVADSADSVEFENIQNAPTTYTPSAHNHDNEYYKKTESDANYQAKGNYATTTQLTSGLGEKANITSVYTKVESDDNYQVKGSYATTTELSTGLSGKADSGVSYTKTESDGKYALVTALNGKADTSYVNTELGNKLTASKVATQEDSEAEDIETLLGDFNSLLAKLKAAGVMS